MNKDIMKKMGFEKAVEAVEQKKCPLCVKDIKMEDFKDKISEVEYASNPATLDRFIRAKIAEGMMRGNAIDEIMKQLKLFGIITLITVVIHLMLFMHASGMLSNLQVPGIT